MSENTCRICRGEATESQPLLHPCKCRGSIKYTHQDCLLEWLNHSNKSTSKCDICNTPYKFRTIYDPQMPKTIPVRLVWEKLVLTVVGGITNLLWVFLYIACIVVQIPLYWKFIGRVFTWTLDGHLPQENNLSLFVALLFGSHEWMPETNASLSTVQIFGYALKKFIVHTYLPGLLYVTLFILAHIALFIVHEYVVRDKGFNPLLLREIGEEPQVKLLEVLEKLLANIRRGENNVDNEASEHVRPRADLAAPNAAGPADDMVRRALHDLQNEDYNDALFKEELLRGFIDERWDGQPRPVAAEEDANGNFAPTEALVENQNGVAEDPAYTEEGLRRFIDNQLESNRNENVNAQPAHFDAAEHFAFNFDEDDLNLDDEEADPFLHDVRRPEAMDALPIPRRRALFNQLPDRRPQPPPQQQAQRNLENILQEAARARNAEDQPRENENNANNNANAGELGEEEVNGDFLDLLGINFNNLRTPIYLMALGNSIISVYLFLAYLVPHMIGNFITGIIGNVFKLLLLIDKLPFPQWSKTLTTGNESVDTALYVINKMYVKPAFATVERIFDPQHSNPGLFERFVFLTIGYMFFVGAIHRFMKKILNSSRKPIMGTPRKVYKILFEIAVTTKVFVVFFVDIVFFPIYCAWLLDFSVSPLFFKNLTKPDPTDGTYVFTVFWSEWIHEHAGIFAQFVFYWLMGTLYMVCLTVFVGMVRDRIVRGGVLWFIRSPDDPDPKLVNDTLKKPLKLQLSRINLCIRIYFGFIVIFIGGVIWLLHWGFSGDENTKATILPIQVPLNKSALIVYILLALSFNERKLVTQYCRLYWTKVFELATHKLRLSHFILGRVIPQERGYVVYRNMWQQILAVAVPDYSQPVSYRGALRIFEENPSVNACFVPDGNYVRAPEYDTANRSYVRTLFVPVTKDDKLLSSSAATAPTATNSDNLDEDGYDSDSSLEEGKIQNSYIVVYRPPNFKMRCFGLIVLLWLFAVLLILSVVFLGLILGRPMLKAGDVAYNAFLLYGLKMFAGLEGATMSVPSSENAFDWHCADLVSLLLGVKLECIFLKYYHGESDDQVVNEVQQEAAGPNAVDVTMLTFSYFFTFLLWMQWIASVHKQCVDIPLRLALGLLSVSSNDNSSYLNEFIVTKLTIAVHLFVGLFTVLPFCKLAVSIGRGYFAGGENMDTPRFVWKKCALPVLANFLITHFPTLIAMVQTYLYSESSISVKLYASALAVLIVYKVVTGALALLKNINAKVKNEKYVQGKAIENME